MTILSISGFFQTLDPTQLLPPALELLEMFQKIILISLLIAPVVMLLSGLRHLLIPAAMPNYKSGFRTYFGLGSKAAWDYTQKLAGFIWTGLGGLLSIVMMIIYLIGRNNEMPQITRTAIVCLIVQVSLAFLAWATITVLVTVNFTRRGQRRK